ncbi:hypothetical protein SLS61_000973 [Didymella pomorum]
MGNQRFLHYDDQGRLEKLEICYQYRCGWDTGVSFTHAIRAKQQSTYFCINFPSGARERLEAIYKYEDRRIVFHRDFFLDTLVADDSLKQWQVEIGERRLMLLGIEEILERPSTDQTHGKAFQEKENENGAQKIMFESVQSDEERDIEMQSAPTVAALRKSHTAEFWREKILKKSIDPSKPDEIDFDKATRHLHKMIRHWLGLRQDCEDLLAQLAFLQKTYNMFRAKRGKDWKCDRRVDAGESFEALISQCDICLFHLANQRTAEDTAKIAEQTQRDSASMITLAAVTMVFLPGTFICTIVSTNFFDFGEQGLAVSDQWWVLLAAAIPLTILVFIVWWAWVLARIQKQKGNRVPDMLRSLMLRSGKGRK